MRILFLTQILPYPPDAGPRVKTLNVLRYLEGLGHEIVLGTYVRSDEVKHINALADICEAVHTVQIRRSKFGDSAAWLESLFRRTPFLVQRDNKQEMRELVQELRATSSFDVVHVDQLSMAQFVFQDEADEASREGRILDAHNAVWSVLDRMEATSTPLLRPLLRMEMRRIKSYEGQLVRHFDQTLAVSESDRQALLEAVEFSENGSTKYTRPRLSEIASRITVVPISIDTMRQQPIDRQVKSTDILAMGSMHYPPNADGILWFAHEIFPRIQRTIPGAKLTIVGKSPQRRIRKLGERSGGSIRVTGYVPDLDPYLSRAVMLVVPVRAGGGMRVRILEGFARGMPMVTTTLGLEGIHAQPERDILVADAPAEFAAAVVRIMLEEELRESLAANGRKLAEQLFDWHEALNPLGELYGQIDSATH